MQRINGSDGIATVDFTISGGTADDNDFNATSGTLTWPDGDSNPQSITVSAATDTLLEPSETVLVVLQNPVGVTLGASTATVTINDATLPTPGALGFTTTAVSVDEGDSVDIMVARSGGSDGEVSVNLTAAASTGYTISPATLTWADGETAGMTVTVAAAEDEATDDSESFNLQLTAATGGVTFAADTVVVTINDTTVPPAPAAPAFTALATDGQWEVCIPPFSPQGPGAFATQLSANEGRVVSCIKTCDAPILLDQNFAGFGFNVAAGHSCTTARDAPGTYTGVPVYTPARTAMNLNLNIAALAVEDSIWGCTVETRTSADTAYVDNGSNTIWYQFFADATYQFGSSQDGTQPEELLGTDVWSVSGRILELGHINTGYRNTLFVDSGTLHIHPTTDDRLNCTLQTRATATAVVPPVVVPQVVVPPVVVPPVVVPPVIPQAVEPGL